MKRSAASGAIRVIAVAQAKEEVACAEGKLSELGAPPSGGRPSSTGRGRRTISLTTKLTPIATGPRMPATSQSSPRSGSTKRHRHPDREPDRAVLADLAEQLSRRPPRRGYGSGSHRVEQAAVEALQHRRRIRFNRRMAETTNRVMVPGYRHVPGNHCGSTALRNLLAFHGVEISEEMAFGLGAGACFYYVVLDEHSPTRFTNGRAARLEENFLELTEVPLRLRTEPVPEASWGMARTTSTRAGRRCCSPTSTTSTTTAAPPTSPATPSSWPATTTSSPGSRTPPSRTCRPPRWRA